MRNIIIITAAAFILILLGLWSYLLFFGSPDSTSQIFVDLGFKEPTVERPLLITDINKSNSETLVIDGALSQLTVRPVAGYVITNRPTDRLRYAERGTGYIYEINFTTKIETRILGTTVAKTTSAYFSPDGLLAVLINETDNGSGATLTTIPEVTGTSAITTKLPDNITGIKVLSSTTLNYLQEVNGESVAYHFNRLTGKASELWRIPLTDIKVWWGPNETYAITKPAPYLKGAVYEVVGAGQLVPVTAQGYNYLALFNDASGEIIETKFDAEIGKLVSEKISTDQKDNLQIAILAIPEKCAFNPTNSGALWCGAAIPDNKNVRRDFTRDWYMGVVTSKDSLWQSDFNKQSSSEQVRLTDLSGLIIDVIEPKFNIDGSRLFFLNKIDGTLWLYNLATPAASQNQIPTAAVPLNP